jgi:predicted AAA+ superfamily ATPase
MIERKNNLQAVQKLVDLFPVTAILGARQIGKTTLARLIRADHYYDLENPKDLSLFDNPQTLLERLKGLVVIDEIQCKAELFSLLRYLVDTYPQTRYLILGSASRDLIRQSSESLAGRIGYHQLGGLDLKDVGNDNIERLWLGGGFPKAYTAKDIAMAQIWLENYITTFLERDIPQLGISIAAQTLRRFWMMLCHYHGQIINYAEMATSFGVSDHTIRRYIEILCGTFMVRTLHPWHENVGKRQVKRPKVYVRDSGLFHCLMAISSMESLLSHPKLGASWEGFAMEMAVRAIGKQDNEIFFWKAHNGPEVDLYWLAHGKNWAVEFKFSDAPGMTASMKTAIEVLNLEHLWVIYPGDKRYPLHPKITVLPLAHVGNEWQYP